MTPSPLIHLGSIALVLLTAAAAEAGRATKRQKLSAVIDHTINGRVVRRKLVLKSGGRSTPRVERDTLAREAHALRKGWSVTEEATELPTQLTLGGRLQEIGFRERNTRRGTVTTITLASANAGVIQGEREVHVYHLGRVVRSRKLASRREALAEPAAAKARGPRTTGPESVEALHGDGWVTLSGSQLEIDREDPNLVVFTATDNPTWLIDRAALQGALDGITTRNEAIYEPVGNHIEIRLRDQTLADHPSIRVKRADLRALLDD